MDKEKTEIDMKECDYCKMYCCRFRQFLLKRAEIELEYHKICLDSPNESFIRNATAFSISLAAISVLVVVIMAVLNYNNQSFPCDLIPLYIIVIVFWILSILILHFIYISRRKMYLDRMWDNLNKKAENDFNIDICKMKMSKDTYKQKQDKELTEEDK